MKNRINYLLSIVVLFSLILSACGGTQTTAPEVVVEEPVVEEPVEPEVIEPAGTPDFAVDCGVYKEEDFDKSVRNYVPEDEAEYVASPQEAGMFTLAMNEGTRVLIYGPKGSGKSTMPKRGYVQA